MNADIQGELFDFSEGLEKGSGVLVYRNDATGLKLDVRLDGETVWLSPQQLDNLLNTIGEQVLDHKGHISHEQAMEKAECEYRKYQVKNLSPVEEAYLSYMQELADVTRNTPKE